MALDDDAFSRALLMAGLGMMNQPNVWAGLSRGGMFGVQGYDQALEQKRKTQDDALLQQQKQLQVQQLMTSIQREQQRQAILGGTMPAQGGQNGPPAPTAPSVVMGSDLANNPLYKPSAPAPAPAAGNPQSIAQKLLAAGFVKEAEEYAKANGVILGDDRYGKIEAKDYTPDSLRKFQVTGNRADLVPRDEIVADNLGGQLSYRTKFSTAPLGKADKTMTLAEQDAARRGWAEYGINKMKLDRGELHDFPTANGGTGLGFVTPQGVSMVPGSGEKMPEQPAAIRTALAANNVMLDKIDRAQALVDQQPGAFGLKNILGDTVRQRTNPEGVDARALVADIGSQKIHDRSGSAVTVSESPRLMPFIPTVNDTPDVIKRKLANFKREYSLMQQELAGGRSISQVAGPKDVTGGGQTPSIAEIQAEMLRRGRH